MTADIIDFPPSMIADDFESRLGEAFDQAQVLSMALQALASHTSEATDAKLGALQGVAFDLETKMRGLPVDFERGLLRRS